MQLPAVSAPHSGACNENAHPAGRKAIKNNPNFTMLNEILRLLSRAGCREAPHWHVRVAEESYKQKKRTFFSIVPLICEMRNSLFAKELILMSRALVSCPRCTARRRVPFSGLGPADKGRVSSRSGFSSKCGLRAQRNPQDWSGEATP